MAQIRYTRLIALGCSHTYGHGLKDCFVPPHGYDENPSVYAWPNQLARLLDIDYVFNLALPGCSNKYIAHSAVNFKFEPNDLVVALWTYNDRTGIFHSDNDYRVIAHWDDNKYSRKFMKSYYSNYDVSFQNSVYINYLNLYLKEQNTNYFYDFIDQECREMSVLDSNFVDLDFNKHRKNYGSSLDGHHMDEQGHYEWAERWHKKIKR